MEATAHPRVMPIAYVQANAVFARGWTIRWRDIEKTLRDLLLPVVIVFALIVLEVIIGEESLPAVPKLPAVDTACDPHPPGANVSRGAVCWYYPVRATHEHVVGYAPNNYASINALMADVLPRVADSAPRLHAEWTGELTMRGFETESALVEFYKTQPHSVYAGVVFPRFLPARDAFRDLSNAAAGLPPAGAPPPLDETLRVDESFQILMNGSYVPGGGLDGGESVGDECRPQIAADGSLYSPKGRGTLPTLCSSMSYLSTGFLHLQSAMASALGQRAVGDGGGDSSLGCGPDAAAANISASSGALTVEIAYAQAPLPEYDRGFGSVTMRLFAAVYLTGCLVNTLYASTRVILDDRASRAKETLQAAGLTSAAYWVGTALLTVCSNAASGGFLVFATVFLGFFDLISAPPLLLLTSAYAAAATSLGFLIATIFKKRRAAEAAVGSSLVLSAAIFIPQTLFGAPAWKVLIANFLAPVAFAGAMDVAVQAQAGGTPLTLTNFASDSIGRDPSTGGAGGHHAITALEAFFLLLFDAIVYALVALYVENAKRWGDGTFMFRRQFWRGGGALFGGGGGAGDIGAAVALEMEDPSMGGRVEVLLEDVLIGEEDESVAAAGEGASASASAAPATARRRRRRLEPTVKLVDVVVNDALALTPAMMGGRGGARGKNQQQKRWRSWFGSRSGSNRRAADRRVNVVDGVSLAAHSGQILALLGHSGSGKSAIIELIAGSRARAEGEMECFGTPTRVKWDPASEGVSVGLCAQHAVSEGGLTAREHLGFFARLHKQIIAAESASISNGYHSFHSDEDIAAMEELLTHAGLMEGLTPNMPIRELDPGQRRALQVVLAFAGVAMEAVRRDADQSAPATSPPTDGTSAPSPSTTTTPPAAKPRTLVLLDEPTSDDMDPALQKMVWSLIRRYKSRCTIVIATRSVTEATSIADRVAMISHGKIKCVGSPTFLTKLFGLGYRLHVTFKQQPTGVSRREGEGDPGLAVLAKVRERCPKATTITSIAASNRTDISQEVTSSSLPLSSRHGEGGGGARDDATTTISLVGEDVPLGKILTDLTSAADALHIADAALEATSLDEVFTKLGQEAEEESETLLPLDAGVLAFGDDSLTRGLLGLGLGGGDGDDDEGGGSSSAVELHRARVGRKRGNAAFARDTAAIASLRLKEYARTPWSTCALFLLPAVVALLLLSIQTAVRNARPEHRVSTYARWVPAASGSAAADDDATRVSYSVSDTVGHDAASDAAAVMTAALGSSEAANLAATTGALASVVANPGANALHVSFTEVNLAACVVRATVTYDPLADVHVLPRTVSNLYTSAIRAVAANKTAAGAASAANVTAVAAHLPYETPFGSAWSYLASMAVPVALLYVPVRVAATATNERVSSHRLTLTLSGLSPAAYWTGGLLVDLALSVASIFLVALCGTSVGVAPWDDAAAPAALCVLLSAFPSLILCAYAMSFSFEDAFNASHAMTTGFQVLSLFAVLILLPLDGEDESTSHYHLIVSAVFPPYALLGGSHLVCWKALSDDNGPREPRASDFFEDELIPVGMRGAVVGWFLWAALLLHAERDHARRLRDGVNVIGAAEAEAAAGNDAVMERERVQRFAATHGGPQPIGEDDAAAQVAADLAAAVRARTVAQQQQQVADAEADAEAGTVDVRSSSSSDDDAPPPYLFAAVGVSAPAPRRQMHVSDDFSDFSDLPVAVTEGPGAGAVCNLYLGVAPREVVALVGGARSSGKEAALRCAAGVDAFGGDVLVTSVDQSASATSPPEIGGRRARSLRRNGVVALERGAVGVCLKDDALWERLSVLEHLTLHATIHGLDRPRTVAYAAAEAVGLTLVKAGGGAQQNGTSGGGDGITADGETFRDDGFADDGVGGGGGNWFARTFGRGQKNASAGDAAAAAILNAPARELSASRRRQLAVAIALLGDPMFLLLDAPTRAVDSHARRAIWARIQRHAARGGGALVSSDAMDEVEAICTRVCALVDGDVAAVDTPRRMKARHGLSYHLRVTLRGGGGGDDAAAAPSDQSDTATSASPDDVAACHAVVRSVAPSALTSETASFDGGVGCAYELSRLSLPGLARLCAKLESAGGADARDVEGLGDGVKSGAGATRGLIEAYTLSQPTLQQVLLNLQGRS